jgi:hypothetical protein
MNTEQIITTLKQTPYKYTYAAKVKDYLKKDADGNAEQVIDNLRMALGNASNTEIARPIKEILKYFRQHSF